VLLPRFEYVRATSLLQASTLLAENPAAQPLAGGTDLLVDLRERRRQPPTLVDVGDLPELRGIESGDGVTRIGAGVTVGELLTSPLITTRVPALEAAARDFADFLTRNKATLGGNVANASPGADLVVPLLALDAGIVLAGPSGERTVPLDAFLVGPRRTVAHPGELIREVVVSRHGGRQAWYKLGLKRGGAIAVVSVATWIAPDAAGRVADARIALGAVGPRPFRPREAEAHLVGAVLDPERIGQAADLAAGAARPSRTCAGAPTIGRPWSARWSRAASARRRTPRPCAPSSSR
jgi:carbon-monoxide dehydrogenase medium subunit